MFCSLVKTLWYILFVCIYIYFIILHIIMSPNIFNNWITPDMKKEKIIDNQNKYIKKLENKIGVIMKEKLSNDSY